MKKLISVWALLARSSFLKIMAVLVGMVSVEAFLLWKTCDYDFEQQTQAAQQFEGGIGNGFSVFSGPERIWEHSFAGIVFLVALGILFFVLVWTEGRRKGSQVEYTWKRLRITKRRLAVAMISYNIACFVILFAMQIAVGIWSIWLYSRMVPFAELVSPQIFFLSFTRSRYLHNILPMMATGRWVRNILLVLALSIAPARNTADCIEEKKERPALYIGLILLVASLFYCGLGLQPQEMVLDGVLWIWIILDLIHMSGVLRERKG